jgi:cytochrome c
MKHVLMMAVAGFVLAGCGGSGDAPEPRAPDTSATETQGNVSAPETNVAETDEAPAPPPANDPEPSDNADELAILASLPGEYSQADLDAGRRQFRRCSSCHTLAEGGPNRVGPNLHGLFDRSTGEVDGFNYSSALRDAGIDWSPEHLDAWLSDPRGYIPGNRMSFVGIRDADDRRDLIAYLLVETAR